MGEQAPIVIILAPLFGALLIAFVGIRFKGLCLPLTLGALAVSLTATVETFRTVLAKGAFVYLLGGPGATGGREGDLDRDRVSCGFYQRACVVGNCCGLAVGCDIFPHPGRSRDS